MAEEMPLKAQQGMEALAGLMVDAGADFAVAVMQGTAAMVVGDGVTMLQIVEALRQIADGIEQEQPNLIGKVTVERDDDDETD